MIASTSKLSAAIRDEDTDQLFCPECTGGILAKSMGYWNVYLRDLKQREGAQILDLADHDHDSMDNPFEFVCDCEGKTWDISDIPMIVDLKHR